MFAVERLSKVAMRVGKVGFEVLLTKQIFKTIGLYPRMLQSLKMLHELSDVGLMEEFCDRHPIATVFESVSDYLGLRILAEVIT